MCFTGHSGTGRGFCFTGPELRKEQFVQEITDFFRAMDQDCFGPSAAEKRVGASAFKKAGSNLQCDFSTM